MLIYHRGVISEPLAFCEFGGQKTAVSTFLRNIILYSLYFL